MKRQMIKREQLRFPAGTARRRNPRSLYSKGAEGPQEGLRRLLGRWQRRAGWIAGTDGTLAEKFARNGPAEVCWKRCEECF